MNAQVEEARIAWQPLTARGVAGFAGASWGRLLVVQLIVALLGAGAVVWVLHKAWFPMVSEAIDRLPTQGAIQSGLLDWPGGAVSDLAENRFLGLVVDLDHTGGARSPAHVQVEFGRKDFKVYSLLGYVRFAYPKRWRVPFNRTELGPWWGAWAPEILAVAAGLVVAVLMVSWACLATVYFLPVWVVGFFANRSCGLAGAWRLAGAAQMPGALLMCAAIVCYGWGAMDLVGLTVASAAHFLVGWVYLLVATFRLPRHPAGVVKENPFA
jgi:hypothetical protein